MLSKVSAQIKGKVGRPGKITSEQYEREFEKYQKDLIIDGVQTKYTSEVFDNIAKELETSRKVVYVAFLRYINKKKVSAIQKSSAKHIVNSEANQSDEEFTVFDEKFKIGRNDLQFNLNITNIDLFNVNCSDFKKQAEWSDTFNEIVWEFARLPCAWSFTSKNVANEKVVFGKCRSIRCEADLFAYTENNRSQLRIVIKKFKENVTHIEKRKVKSANKERIAQMLQMNKASYVHAELADELLQSDDFEAAHLPNPRTLWKIRQRDNEKNYRDSNAIVSLCLMKTEGTFNKCIGDIGIDPFYCFFVTPEQKQWLRLTTRSTRCIISIDSTGAPVRPPAHSSISSSTGRLKPVFLYTISLQVKNSKSCPVFQCLSQRHTSDFICYFLKCWRYSCNSSKNPDEVIMDNSSALILSSITCFTTCSTAKMYLDRCFEALFDSIKPSIECYIRLDRSHIVKQILRTRAISKLDPRIKALIYRVLGFLITVDSITIAKDIISNIFILLMNKYEHCEQISKSKWALKTISDYHEFPDDHDIHYEDNEEIADNFSIGLEECKFKQWVKRIIANVQSEYVDEKMNDSLSREKQDELNIRENLYYVQDEKHELQNSLVNLISIIPMWSNVMLSYFKSVNTTPSSSPTEVEFKNVKHVIFRSEKNIRVDIFVEKYTQYLLGKFKYYLAENKNKCNEIEEDRANEKEEKTNCSAQIIDCSNRTVEVSQEIWRNKNVDLQTTDKPIKRSKRTQFSILNVSQPYCASIPILPNGGTTKGNKSKPTTLCHNSCTFDCFYQVYAVAYKDVENFRSYFENSEMLFDCFLVNTFTGKIKMSTIVEDRSELLCTLFPDKVVFKLRNMRAINTFMALNEMYTALISQSKVVYSMKDFIVCSNESCNLKAEKKHKYVTTQFKGDWEYIITHLQEFLLTDTKKVTEYCGSCDSIALIERNFNDIVIINIEDAYPNRDIFVIDRDKISPTIILNGENYFFKAAVEYKPSHFVAHTLRANNRWESYDGLQNTLIQRTPKSFYPVFLFYGKSNVK